MSLRSVVGEMTPMKKPGGDPGPLTTDTWFLA
jgi:hypothetical protein